MEKRQKYEIIIKNGLKNGAEKLGKFLNEIDESFRKIKDDLTFFEHNRFEDYYKSVKIIKKYWEEKSENMTDEEFFKFYTELKDNKWEFRLSSMIFTRL